MMKLNGRSVLLRGGEPELLGPSLDGMGTARGRIDVMTTKILFVSCMGETDDIIKDYYTTIPRTALCLINWYAERNETMQEVQ